MEDKKKIQVELVRKDGKTYFRFNIHKDIEKLYKNSPHEIRTSNNWPGLKFYYIPSILEDRSYNDKLHDKKLIDDYGASLYIANNQKLNIAWLRTVGGSGEILLKNDISFAELSLLVKNALSFIKEYFEEYFREFKIKGSVTLEL